MNAIQLNPKLRPAAIREVFARSGRVHIPDLLQAESAQAIHRALSAAKDWQLSLNSGERHLDLSEEQLQLLPTAQQVLLVERVHQNARSAFQYVFNNIPMHDLHARAALHEQTLVQTCDLLNSAEFLALMREITGMPAIAFADSQATWYRPGHFLTTHDDAVDGKNRLVAYVLSLTQHWQADWGGILQFIDEDGHVAEGYTPRFNALNLFRVPQRHCVSYVTPAAGAARYSITGWLRSG